MKTPHKHAALIKQWADGAKIEYKSPKDTEWRSLDYPGAVIGWHDYCDYRVKPEPKPDVVYYAQLTKIGDSALAVGNYFTRTKWEKDNVMFVFDGETGKLKDAQVLASSGE